MPYLVKILVEKKPGILNPEARVINQAAAQLGYEISELSCGREFSYRSEKESEQAVRKEAEELATKLFTNPIVENYEIKLIKKI